MKRAVIILILLLPAVRIHSYAARVVVHSIHGSAELRRGVSEEWRVLQVGDVLKPEDSIRSGENGEVKLEIGEGEYFILPSLSILDIADLRQLTRQELLLKLSLEYIRSIPDGKSGTRTPSVTIMHGDDRSSGNTVASATDRERTVDAGMMRLEGARALYQQRYYATCILAVKSAIRKFGVRDPYGAHKLVAISFENMGLIQQSIDEYSLCSALRLTESQQNELQQELARLKRISR